MVEDVRGLQLEAETLAASLPALLIAVDRVAANVTQGAHGRRRSGPGENFWQFRRYQPGDPATAIDWRQSAKSDPLYVRETEWAAAQTVWVWPDPSPSMRWRSRSDLPEKHRRAALLALVVALLLLQGGERVGLLGGGEAPGTGTALLPAMAGDMLASAGEGALPDVPVARRAHVLLLSDFLMPPERLEAQLRRWADAGVQGHLVHLLDPAEIDLPYQGRVRFSGLEGEGDVEVPRAEALREAYAARLAAHRAALRELTGAMGWTLLDHRTDEEPGAAVIALHNALARR
ncbi:DUF58 domain-containing protein [Telmatospirillum siberiense]|uniref:DUF58 domain-containing protein n=1 Tax=Telmatospirillum siberiense TaxID=382514 RepID=A0A2N3PTU5_9PROT|nr:DUF58 domain-containing protein [Telmatospirillum siberiense]PKU23807.1 DUF58 domain-containing protein [Telmatospirillum siberiense]